MTLDEAEKVFDGDDLAAVQMIGRCLVNEVRRLRAALEIYADPKNWAEHDNSPYGVVLLFVHGSVDVAQEALNPTDDETELPS